MDFETDRFILNEDLASFLQSEVKAIKQTHLEDQDLVDACDTILLLCNTDSSVADICRMGRNLQAQLERKDKLSLITPQVTSLLLRFQDQLRLARDPLNPLTPNLIINSDCTLFPGSPWYAASFTHSDPEAGITGSQMNCHVLYLRIPEQFRIKDGSDLPADYFLKHLDYIISSTGKPFVIRMHSECHYGDVGGQGRCDCGIQLEKGFMSVEENELGCVAYLRQEGRGVGLTQKFQLVAQEEGRDEKGRWIGPLSPDESFRKVTGHQKADLRTFSFLGRLLRGLGLQDNHQIHLISDNISKLNGLKDSGFTNITQVEAMGGCNTVIGLTEQLEKLIQGRYKFSDLTTKTDSMKILRDQMQLLQKDERIHDSLFHVLSLMHSVLEECNLPLKSGSTLSGLKMELRMGAEILKRRRQDPKVVRRLMDELRVNNMDNFVCDGRGWKANRNHVSELSYPELSRMNSNERQL